MAHVLSKALAFAAIIFLAFVLKKVGLFGPTDYRIMAKVVLNVTLPAAVIVSFATNTLDLSLLLVSLLGCVCNVAMLFAGFLLGRGKSKGLRALSTVCASGYNIGAFALPFAQSFLGAPGMMSACLFDAGNAIMCTGGSYATADLLINGKGQNERLLPCILKKLASSTPFLTYTLMFLLSLCRVQIPTTVADFLQPIANANAFCAMFMIGLMFEIKLKKETLRTVLLTVLLRTVSAAALSAVCYFVLPLPLATRQALALIVFAPPAAIAPVFTERCGGDAGAASCVSSLCILTALIGMTAVLTMMNL